MTHTLQRTRTALLALALAIAGALITVEPAEAAIYVTPYITTACSSSSYVRFHKTNGDNEWVYPCTTERHMVTAVYNYLGQSGRCYNYLNNTTLVSWGAGSGWVDLPDIVRNSGYHLGCKVW